MTSKLLLDWVKNLEAWRERASQRAASGQPTSPLLVFDSISDGSSMIDYYGSLRPSGQRISSIRRGEDGKPLP